MWRYNCFLFNNVLCNVNCVCRERQCARNRFQKTRNKSSSRSSRRPTTSVSTWEEEENSAQRRKLSRSSARQSVSAAETRFSISFSIHLLAFRKSGCFSSFAALQQLHFTLRFASSSSYTSHCQLWLAVCCSQVWPNCSVILCCKPLAESLWKLNFNNNYYSSVIVVVSCSFVTLLVRGRHNNAQCV